MNQITSSQSAETWVSTLSIDDLVPLELLFSPKGYFSILRSNSSQPYFPIVNCQVLFILFILFCFSFVYRHRHPAQAQTCIKSTVEITCQRIIKRWMHGTQTQSTSGYSATMPTTVLTVLPVLTYTVTTVLEETNLYKRAQVRKIHDTMT